MKLLNYAMYRIMMIKEKDNFEKDGGECTINT